MFTIARSRYRNSYIYKNRMTGSNIVCGDGGAWACHTYTYDEGIHFIQAKVSCAVASDDGVGGSNLIKKHRL